MNYTDAYPLEYRGATLAESHLALRLYERLNTAENQEIFQNLGLKIFISSPRDQNNYFTPRVQSVDEKGNTKWMIVIGSSWCSTYFFSEREMEKEILLLTLVT